MINTREDVLNAKHEVSAGNLQRMWHRFHNERRQGRHDPGHLRRAVETFNPHKHVSERGGESLNADSGTGETSLTLDAPLFGVSIVGKKSVRLFEIGAGLRELGRKGSSAWHRPLPALSRTRRRCLGLSDGVAGRRGVLRGPTWQLATRRRGQEEAKLTGVASSQLSQFLFFFLVFLLVFFILCGRFDSHAVPV